MSVKSAQDSLLTQKCLVQSTSLPAWFEHYPFFRSSGCAGCSHTGRQGNLAAFDVFRVGADRASILDQPSLLSVQAYILRLAALGYVALDDVADFEANQLRRTYTLLANSEHALAEANAALQRKLAQLEAANKVLQQGTEAVISLQDISHLKKAPSCPNKIGWCFTRMA